MRFTITSLPVWDSKMKFALLVALICCAPLSGWAASSGNTLVASSGKTFESIREERIARWAARKKKPESKKKESITPREAAVIEIEEGIAPQSARETVTVDNVEIIDRLSAHKNKKASPAPRKTATIEKEEKIDLWPAFQNEKESAPPHDIVTVEKEKKIDPQPARKNKKASPTPRETAAVEKEEKVDRWPAFQNKKESPAPRVIVREEKEEEPAPPRDPAKIEIIDRWATFKSKKESTSPRGNVKEEKILQPGSNTDRFIIPEDDR